MHRVSIIIVTENPPSWKITFLAGFVLNTIGYSRLPLTHTCFNSLITNLWNNIIDGLYLNKLRLIFVY